MMLNLTCGEGDQDILRAKQFWANFNQRENANE